MSITVIKPGLLVTLQDAGRRGYGRYGIIMAGAMDNYAYRIVNRLVGNEDERAVLEITWSGFAVEFHSDRWVAITGGDLSPSIEGVKVPMWRPVLIKAGRVLRFQQPVTGCRAYMAVSGGFDVCQVMGSSSTYLRARIGGFEGRPLKKGDTLHAHPSRLPLVSSKRYLDDYGGFLTVKWAVSAEGYPGPGQEAVIRVLKGRQYDDFDEGSKQALLGERFTVTPQSDRMGYRLSGPLLQLSHAKEYISEPVALGTVQVPADGQPIILMADRQTLGGYPKIAQVATVDISLIAQLSPGAAIRFAEISLADAEQLYTAHVRELRMLETMIKLKLKEW
ncbi:5-oxoprolinase subunit C family protein [Paenibacillus lautus]|uniref:5-oxoprolinase subunit C family protein n=1 Tax=Paenibacillus lautus TaxID=1401 RepID=UPI002DBECC93|nr:biotin-dependent carboxyltransferase family protein [Paenibacillus lautus]MEC0256288.1 biotin-dependent carboxyltransferase family protein [Paenibacillus lautus]